MCFALESQISNINRINVHAATEKSAQSKKDTCPRYDIQIIFRDFNSQIGMESVNRQVAHIAWMKLPMITDYKLSN